MQTLRSIVSGLLVSSVSLVLLDLVLGIVALRDGRFLGWHVPPYGLVFTEGQAENMRSAEKGYGRFDTHLGWSIRAHGVGDDGLYRANAAGFRADREYAPVPPADVLRIASFGDSFTHGAEVPNADTWQSQLEGSSSDLEVLNFGVDGYGVDQAYLRYRRDGLPYAPHVVLIGLFIENINRSVSVYRPAYYHRTNGVSLKPRFLVTEEGTLEAVPLPVGSREEFFAAIESGALLDVLRETDYWVRRAPLAYEHSAWFWSSLVRIAYGRYENSGRNLERHYAAGLGSEPFRVTLSVIERFHREALERGAREVLVLIFPDEPGVRKIAEADGEPYWRTLEEALEARGVPVLDLAPALVEAARSLDPKSLFQGYHYSRRGNAVVAGALARRLLSEES